MLKDFHILWVLDPVIPLIGAFLAYKPFPVDQYSLSKNCAAFFYLRAPAISDSFFCALQPFVPLRMKWVSHHLCCFFSLWHLSCLHIFGFPTECISASASCHSCLHHRSGFEYIFSCKRREISYPSHHLPLFDTQTPSIESCSLMPFDTIAIPSATGAADCSTYIALTVLTASSFHCRMEGSTWHGSVVPSPMMMRRLSSSKYGGRSPQLSRYSRMIAGITAVIPASSVHQGPLVPSKHAASRSLFMFDTFAQSQRISVSIYWSATLARWWRTLEICAKRLSTWSA